MKALEILKKEVIIMEKAKETNPESISYWDKQIKIYNEAVAELEDMQENLKASEKTLLNLNRLDSDEAKEV